MTIQPGAIDSRWLADRWLPRGTALIALAACLFLVAAPLWAGKPADRGNRPNIVLLVADDLGWSDVGWHGSEIRTPRLDALAASGKRLERHYVYPTCSPTRVALLTGRNPSRFKIHAPIAGASEQALPLDTVTLADVLRTRGYQTMLVGKWHLGLQPQVGPLQYGFEQSYGYLHGQVDVYTHLYKTGAQTWHRNDTWFDEPGHATDLIAQVAVRFIEQPREQPFFLYVPFNLPHTPLNEPAERVAAYGTIEDPDRRLYAAAVTHLDDAIGRVIDALTRTGQLERTLVLFTSDNGGQQSDSHGNGKLYGGQYPPIKTLGNNRPLRGWKTELFEGGVRVPALINWPGTIEPGVIDDVVWVGDWLPTLARVVGYEPDAQLAWEGIDVGPQLRGSSAPRTKPIYWNIGRGQSVRVGDFKLIDFGRGKTELFNLADDPYEQKPLDDPARQAELTAVLAAQRALDPQ